MPTLSKEELERQILKVIDAADEASRGTVGLADDKYIAHQEALIKGFTALLATQNTALLKELLGELPEEIDMMHAKKAHSDAGAGNVIGHNHLLSKVKNLINSKLAAMGER